MLHHKLEWIINDKVMCASSLTKAHFRATVAVLNMHSLQLVHACMPVCVLVTSVCVCVRA